jgi:hypothetical protein
MCWEDCMVCAMLTVQGWPNVVVSQLPTPFQDQQCKSWLLCCSKCCGTRVTLAVGKLCQVDQQTLPLCQVHAFCKPCFGTLTTDVRRTVSVASQEQQPATGLAHCSN